MLREILDLVAPRACLICGCRLAVQEKAMCTSCNMTLPRTNFAEHALDNTMAQLFWGRIKHMEKAAAWIYYIPQTKVDYLLFALKYHFHPEYGEYFGNLMANEMKNTGFFDGIDCILPIPLTKERRRKRGYNQSEELARGIARVTGLPVVTNAVERKSFDKSQTRLNRLQRMENAEKSFVCTHNRDIDLKGKHLLLVDDVVTTGATITACAQELLPYQYSGISILSIGFAKG